MNKNSSLESKKIIGELDSLVDEGYKINEDFLDRYKSSLLPGLFMFTYLPKARRKYWNWEDKTKEVLTKYFPQSSYLSHFLNPPMNDKSISNIDSGFIMSYYLNFDAHIEALRFIIWKLNDKENVVIKNDLAINDYPKEVLYQIAYRSRKIYLNNILISKPDFNSENDNCFQYIYDHPNVPIKLAELEEANGGKLKKRLRDIVRDLGFTGVLKDLFFTGITKDSLYFENPITWESASERKLSEINLSQIGRQMERQVDKTTQE
jgi:hypothetical protein